MKIRIVVLILLFLMAGTVLAVEEGANGFSFGQTLIPLEEIHYGGPPRDGIPAIDRPRFESADISRLADSDQILGIVVGSEARAYPILILNWHEIVNDTIADQPVVISYCPLCGTGVAYSALVDDRLLDFGVSGLLYNSDVLLYDRQTESLWSQLLNRAVSGPLAGSQLVMLPMQHTTWGAWKRHYPQSLVLSRETGYRRDYERDPYAGYEDDRGLYFPVTKRDPRYHPKERVLGVEINGVFKAYPISELSTVKGDVKDRFQGEDLLVRFDTKSRSMSVYDENGVLLPAVTAYWFAWYTFHPETEVYTADME